MFGCMVAHSESTTKCLSCSRGLVDVVDGWLSELCSQITTLMKLRLHSTASEAGI
jgi:hypothetical protein